MMTNIYIYAYNLEDYWPLDKIFFCKFIQDVSCGMHTKAFILLTQAEKTKRDRCECAKLD